MGQDCSPASRSEGLRKHFSKARNGNGDSRSNRNTAAIKWLEVFSPTLKWIFAPDGIRSDSLLGSSERIKSMQNLASDLYSLKRTAVKKVQDIPPQTQLPCFPCRNSKETDSKGRHMHTQTVQLLPQYLNMAGRDLSQAVQTLGSSVTTGCKNSNHVSSYSHLLSHIITAAHSSHLHCPREGRDHYEGGGLHFLPAFPWIQSSISSERGELWYCPSVISISTDTTGLHDSWLAQMSGVITLPSPPPPPGATAQSGLQSIFLLQEHLLWY